MLFANWLDVPDAMAFLDAFAEAAEKTRGWKLEGIKFDYGYQFVYVRYTGRKFAGKGLMASAFAPVHQYRDCEGAVLAGVNAPPIRTPSASAGRLNAGEKSHRLSLALRVPMQQVNLTIHADEWPSHICWDEPAKRLVQPLVKAAHEASRPTLRVVRTRSVHRRRAAQIADTTP